jgi:hypothetical protein
MNKSLTWRLTLVMVAASCDSVLAQHGKDQDPALAAAQKRAELVKTLRMEFKRTDLEAIGSRSANLRGPTKPQSPVPDRETTTESVNRVILDGEKMRFENNHPLWHTKGTLHQTSLIAVSNGIVSKTFRPKGILGDEAPSGMIRSAGDRLDLNEPVLVPVLLCFRGNHGEVCPYPITIAKATGVSLPVNNVPCREYAVTWGNLVVSLWFDPAADYTLRRLAKRKDNKLIHQLDVQYRRDDKWGWLPVSWVMHDYGSGGNLLRTTKVEVVETRVDAPQPADSFELVFPAGTQVFDARSNKEYRVLSNETMREVSSTGEDRGSSVSQDGDGFLRRHQWLLKSVMLIAVVAVVSYAARKRFARALK